MSITLITAPTGAGKSTKFVWDLAKSTGKKILVVEPRVINCLLLDEYARTQKINSGHGTGVSKNFSNNIDYCTTRVAINFIDKYEIIIIDECHEVDLWTVLLYLEVKKTNKEIYLMSATPDMSGEYLDFDTHIVLSDPLNKKWKKEKLKVSYNIDNPDYPPEENYQHPTQRYLSLPANKIEYITSGNIMMYSGTMSTKNYPLLNHTEFKDYKIVKINSKSELQRSYPEQGIIFHVTAAADCGVTLPNIRYIHVNNLRKFKDFDYVLNSRFLNKAELEQLLGRGGRVCDTYWSIDDSRLHPQTHELIYTGRDLFDVLSYAHYLGNIEFINKFGTKLNNFSVQPIFGGYNWDGQDWGSNFKKISKKYKIVLLGSYKNYKVYKGTAIKKDHFLYPQKTFIVSKSQHYEMVDHYYVQTLREAKKLIDLATLEIARQYAQYNSIASVLPVECKKMISEGEDVSTVVANYIRSFVEFNRILEDGADMQGAGEDFKKAKRQNSTQSIVDVLLQNRRFIPILELLDHFQVDISIVETAPVIELEKTGRFDFYDMIKIPISRGNIVAKLE